MSGKTLKEAFPSVEGMYVNAMYKERDDFTYTIDNKKHNHDALSASIPRDNVTPYELRHWVIQDIYDRQYISDCIRLARQYGMTGIQFSGDHIYWVNDSITRYCAYVFTGELCEECHRHGLKAYFWIHEINGFFHEFVRDGRYGNSLQLIGGEIDLSSGSGYWQMLEDKYEVFFSRLPGIDGVVLTLNECQVPVFRDDVIKSDLNGAERVAKIGKVILNACNRHGKELILRTFCYRPEELDSIRKGVDMSGGDFPVMMKCVPHDWHMFYPHNSVINHFADRKTVVEHDLALEFMGGGRFPVPYIDYLKYRFDYSTSRQVNGVAGRLCRFRNRAMGTMNWANVYAFSRLALEPDADADQIWDDYAVAEFGEANRAFIRKTGRKLVQAATETYYVAKEMLMFSHANFSDLTHLEWGSPLRKLWITDDADVLEAGELVGKPTTEFIETVKETKFTLLKDLENILPELEQQKDNLAPGDYQYLKVAVERAIVIAKVHMCQQVVLLMMRFDKRMTVDDRTYKQEVLDLLAKLEEIVENQREQVVAAGNEGCQYNDDRVTVFCDRVRKFYS